MPREFLTLSLQYHHWQLQLQDWNSTSDTGAARMDRPPETVQEAETVGATAVSTYRASQKMVFRPGSP